MEERLQKILARAGIASRRKCEEYITAGRVTVDGKVVRELGAKADPAENLVRCDGVRIKPEAQLHFLLYKPEGFVCTNAAGDAGRRVTDLLRHIEQRLFCVGRLDADSEGLIIITNDGELANRLAHPRYGVSKVYQVEIDGVLTPEQTGKLLKGIHLAEGVVRFAEVYARPVGRGRSVVKVVLRQGLNREIRRAFAALGLRVRRLQRLAIGPVTDPELRPGTYRPLTPQELQALRDEAGMGTQKHEPKHAATDRHPVRRKRTA